ncbi:MAG TPA: MmgE/PrpD family protein [Actinomycetota bacterium]|nr:MmgE/PrpD family protein [Actinomycetota bacterium]
MTAARRISEWALSLHDVPPEVEAKVTRHMLDGVGCALAAVRTGAVPSVLQAVRTSDEEAPVLGVGLRASAPMAALANGALVHALDFDDTHPAALVHATAAVLPAALAFPTASGREVLAAAAAGYETVVRLGAAVPHGFHSRGLHATSVCGVFAAALVASRLIGLDAERTTHALGIAGSLAAGSLEFLHTGSSTKQLHPGLASMNGIMAARLAAAGADGPDTILEGKHGLYRSYLQAEVDPYALTADLGSRWDMLATSMKPYPACQLVLAPLDALRTLLPLPDDDLVFRVPPGAVEIVCEPAAQKARPRTPYEARFSLPFCAAVLATDGELTVDSLERLDRPEVAELAGRVRYEVTSFAGPPAEAPGRVEVGGRVGEAPALRDPSDAELIAKLRANAGGPVERLADTVLGLASLASVEEIFEAALAREPVA